MLYIELSVANRMIEDVKSDDQECCGFFFGYEIATNRTITRSMIVNNSTIQNKQTYFEISVEDYMNAERFAEAQNLRLLGVYHSHPNHPAIPSECDLEMAIPGFSYIIISVIDKKFVKIKSWQLNERLQFEEEEIEFKEEIEFILPSLN
jgi:proteasome lid subunit RPN8/RPN11